MKPTEPSQAPDLGALQAAYENNPAHGRESIVYAALLLAAGLIVLALGARQDLLRDQLFLIVGGLLALGAGARLVADFRSRLNVSAELYEGGLVITGRRKQRIAIRWDEIVEVYEQVIRGGTQMSHAEAWIYRLQRRGGRPVKIDNAIARTRELGMAVQKAVHELMLPRVLETYQAGETVRFGRHLGIGRQGVVLGTRVLSWKQLSELRFTREGSLQIVLTGQRRAWRTIPQGQLANVTTLRALIHQLDELKPSPAAPAEPEPQDPIRRSPFAPGTIGDLSIRLNYDVRDLMMEGYSLDDIQGVLQGEYTLAEMRQRKPGRARRGRR